MNRQHIQILLLTVCLALATQASAQLAFTRVEQQPVAIELPNVELGKAQYLLDSALESGDSPLLIKALSNKIYYQLRISKDSIPPLITEVERITKETPAIETKAMLASLTASLYLAQYERNSYTYNQRTPVVGERPTDIKEWSGVDFFETIYSYVALSIAPREELEQAPALPYEDATARWELPTCTTLYDLVAQRAIDLLQSLPTAGVANYLPQRTFKSETLLAPRAEFLASNFAPYTNQVAATILHLYQTLLEEKTNLVTTDLARIEYGYRIAKSAHLYDAYLAALLHLLESTKGSEQVDVVATYAKATLRSSKYEVLKQTLTLCQEAIANYPTHPRIEELKQDVEQLTAPTFTLDTSLPIYPESSTKLPFSYNNIGKLTIQLYKDSTQLVQEIQHPLSDTLTLISHETTVTLPPLAMGKYQLVVYPDTLTKLAQSTTLHVTHYTTAIVGRAVVVTDSRSGKPQRGVTVELYQNNITCTESLITNKEGVAILPYSTHLYGIRATKGADIYAAITRTPYNYNRDNSRPTSDVKKCDLFTDRSLYRPSDTVSFTGIVYRGDSVLADEAVTLYLYDSSRQLLATKECNTTLFGGFNGTFTLPDAGLQGGYYICNKERSAYAHFEVASYKQPTYEVSLLPIEGLYTFDTPIAQQGVVEGYAGNLLAGATVRYTVSRRATPYSHTRIDVASGESTLDPQGAFAFTYVIPKGESDKASYEVTATVTSLTGESVSATQSMVVATSPVTLSVSMPSYVVRAERVPLAIEVSNYMYRPLAGMACEYRLYTLDDSKGESLMEYTKGEMVSKVRFSSDDTPSAANWEKIPSGAYLLEVVVYDHCQLVASEESRFVLYSQEDKRPPIYTSLWMPKREFSCKQGDKVEVLVGSSEEDCYLSYLLFDGYKLVDYDYVERSNRNTLLTIDYKESYGEELQLVVMRVREGRHQLVRAKIAREKADEKLVIQTESMRDHTTPGAMERWQFTIKHPNGTPAKARFMATLFDASLLALNNHEWRFAPKDRYTYYSPAIAWSRASEQSRLSLSYGGNYTDVSNRLDESMLIPCMDRVVSVGYGKLTKSAMTGAAPEAAEAADKAEVEEVEEGDIPFAYRRNFDETAVFCPDLTTNEQGEVTMTFTLPDAATTWQLYALAYTQQLAVGEMQHTVVSNRALMVQPFLPRFIRDGDRATLTAEVSNLSDTLQQGEVTLELYHPTTQQLIASRVEPFRTQGGESCSLTFDFDAPQGVEVVGVRIRATSGAVSDGEEHLLAVLPNSRLVTETLPILLAGGDSQGTFELTKLATESTPSRNNYRLTLNYTAHPIWYAIQSLPSLTQATSQSALATAHALFAHTTAAAIATQNPQVGNALDEVNRMPLALEDNENLKAILLAQTPWVLEATTQQEQVAQLATLLDTTTTTRLRDKAMAELLQQQQRDGGWAWYRGMPSQPYITTEIVTLLAQLQELGMTTYNEAESKAILAALRYLDLQATKQDSPIWVGYLYLRSLYTDVPLGDALGSHKAMLKRLTTEWRTLSFVEQAKAAQVLYRYGNKQLAQGVINYLLAHATTIPQLGMFWANDSSDGTALPCAMLAALREIEPESKAISPLKQRLIYLKQTTHWGNPTATVNAVYALLHSGDDWLLPTATTADITWGGSLLTADKASPLLGYVEESKQSKEITPALATVTIEREASTQPAWGGLYWQYFEQYDKITASAQQQVTLERRLYLATSSQELIPITDTTPLHVGDKVVVQLAIHTAIPLDFVHLQDERAAALAPTQQLARYRYREGACYYQEPTQAAMNFYFDRLPKGNYLFDYTLVVERAGSYNSGVATVQCLYAPQLTAHTAGSRITIAN